MTDTPGPSPIDDDPDYLFENYESDYAEAEWADALQWAGVGDFRPIINCLRRSEMPMSSQAVRDWLASGLESKKRFPKPRKVMKKPDLVLFEMASGRRFYVQERHLPEHELIKKVHLLRKTMSESDAITRVAVETGTDSEKLLNLVRRPRSLWGLSEKAKDAMFDEAIDHLNTPRQPS